MESRRKGQKHTCDKDSIGHNENPAPARGDHLLPRLMMSSRCPAGCPDEASAPDIPLQPTRGVLLVRRLSLRIQFSGYIDFTLLPISRVNTVLNEFISLDGCYHAPVL